MKGPFEWSAEGRALASPSTPASYHMEVMLRCHSRRATVFVDNLSRALGL